MKGLEIHEKNNHLQSLICPNVVESMLLKSNGVVKLKLRRKRFQNVLNFFSRSRNSMMLFFVTQKNLKQKY